jgi:hypothetical protein
MVEMMVSTELRKSEIRFPVEYPMVGLQEMMVSTELRKLVMEQSELVVLHSIVWYLMALRQVYHLKDQEYACPAWIVARPY